MGGGEIPADVETGDYSTTVQEKDKLCFDNYRGVSLLSHCGKVMTSVILYRIRHRTDDILSEAQAGFRAGRSTTDQLFTLRHLAETYSEFSTCVLRRLSESVQQCVENWAMASYEISWL